MEKMSELITKEGVSRRSVLMGTAAGAGVLAAGGLVGAGTAATANAGPLKKVSVGSNQSDPQPHKADLSWVAAAKTAGFDVKLNTVDHNTFQNQINSYLQGTPDDVFTWFAGYRMQFFAKKGLATSISDVWKKISPEFTSGYKNASTGLDHKQYFIPTTWYPWAIMYRKSVFAAAGVNPKTIVTWADFINACKTFQAKGIIPVALGDGGGWEAMGTFDFINFRTNGFKFHMDLTGGRAKWTDPRVQKTFTNWATMFPYQNKDALDLKWDGAAQLVLQKKAAMQVMGAFHASIYTDPADLADLALFAFPEITPAYGREAVEAPIDGYMLSKHAAKNMGNAKKLAEFIASTAYGNAVLKVAPTALFANKNMPKPTDPFARQQVDLVNGSKYIAQFFDRDSRPDFAGSIFQSALQKFIGGGDPKSIATDLQAQWDALPPA
jgi:multiple sugar transport system substrate-binding protein